MKILISVFLAVASAGCTQQKSAVGNVRDGLKSDQASARLRAVAQLGERRDVESMHFLLLGLKDSNPGVRSESAASLGKQGSKEASKALTEALHDDNVWVRVEAAKALGELDDRASYTPLIDLLEAAVNARGKAASSTWSHGQDATAAALALKKMTGKDCGLNPQKWKETLSQ